MSILKKIKFKFALIGALLTIFLTVMSFELFKKETISYNAHIRPILNANCTGCHGGVKKAGGVSFIYREEALGIGKSGKPCIVPGDPEASELVSRLEHHNAELRMPLGKPALTEEQISLIKKWIKQGAVWEEHWAYVAPIVKPVPEVTDKWVRNDIDRFVLAKLKESETGLEPMPEAEKYVLARRLALDITGLPPSPEALAAFEADVTPNAYETLVDNLLASPSYGERWAGVWLDLARYADTKGYEKDQIRNIWRYRDYLIKSFNDNKPYNVFVQEQLAGDLMPNATDEQFIATAFHRNTLNNDEGGTDNEEFRTAAVIDRVNTTFDVFQGLTMGCVQCHNHPYDPIPQKDYYRFMSYLNNTQDYDHPDDVPNYISAADTPTTRIREILAKLDQLEGGVPTNETYEMKKRRYMWPKLPAVHAAATKNVAYDGPYIAISKPGSYFMFEKLPMGAVETIKLRASSIGGSVVKIYLDKPSGTPILSFDVPENFGEWFEYGDIIKRYTGRHDLYFVFEKNKNGFCNSSIDYVTFSLNDNGESSTNPSTAQGNPFKVAGAGFHASNNVGKANKLSCCWKHGSWAQYQDVNLKGVNQIAIRYEAANGFTLEVHAGDKNGALLITANCEPTNGGYIIKKIPIAAFNEVTPVTLVFKANAKGACDGMLEWVDFNANERIVSKKERQRIDTIINLKSEYWGYVFNRGTPVLRELPENKRRITRVFHRGNWMAKTDTVQAGTPTILNPFPKNVPNNRLGMAQWLTAPENPLTARVAVNRFWEQLFGYGIVETLEDFGSQGTKPTHQELLDYLALKFVNEYNYDCKKLIKFICMSATYRQSSTVRPEHLQKDPRNRFLARAPRIRLSAEQVRDQALAVSGLLSSKMYGPSVMPYQPEGIWQTVYNGTQWITSPGEDRYRRLLYTFVRRSASYPNMLTFDGPTREFCMVRRIRTNTPLQALATLNDTTYIEAAQALARKMITEKELKNQIKKGYRLVLMHDPDEASLQKLIGLHQKAVQFYTKDTERAYRMSGDLNNNQQLAPLALVASAILNLDETITKE